MVYPNQLTVLRIILTPVFLFLFLADDPLLKQISLIVFLLAAITDWYDGWLARKFNYITNWGKFLDPLADKILTSTAFYALVAIGMLDLWMVNVIVIRDFLITGLRSFSEYKKMSFTTSKTAQWKTFVQMIFLYYLLMLYIFKTVEFIYSGHEQIFDFLLNPKFIYYTMLAITLFTLYTGISYLFKNRWLIKRLFTSETKSN
ncbi:MAG: CDP-diacylglycerol--glycerol-3-phosphate 3-phosphatidyltransferase [bacterium]